MAMGLPPSSHHMGAAVALGPNGREPTGPRGHRVHVLLRALAAAALVGALPGREAWAVPPSRLAGAATSAVDRRLPLERTQRRANVDGQYGVLEETQSPIIDTRDNTGEEDPLLKSLVTAVQAADRKRGVDMSAFWINEGWEIVVIITALSRPQLQAIAGEIHHDMRKIMRLKRQTRSERPGQGVRDEAATGWVSLCYPRLNIQIMTPVQRTYYDIEGTWRDENKDYEKIPLDVMLREEGFGNMRLTKELGNSEKEEPDVAKAEEPSPGVDYEEDEDDPFWS